jgi:formylglycine-generating enzyme required for sulfatase activity
MGSTPAEREYGYQLDEQRGSFMARAHRWFEHETRTSRQLDAFLIAVDAVTNADYKAFVDATAHPAPFVTQAIWEGYHLIHGYDTVQRFLWKDRTYPPGRGAPSRGACHAGGCYGLLYLERGPGKTPAAAAHGGGMGKSRAWA